MCSWNPALIVAHLSARSDSWTIGTHHGNLFAWINWLRATARTLCTLSAFAAALLLWEESGDPGAVDEVDSATEGSEDDEVQEDAE